jgi:hypothetical protein
MRWPVDFQRDGDWWDLWTGRLHISKATNPFNSKEEFRISESPGYWYFEWRGYQIAWRRKWTVWKDHPFRGRNIRLYDQFGTFARNTIPAERGSK